MKVYECGTEINIKNVNIDGFITGINIRNKIVRYEISFFSNGKYNQMWMNEYEFKIKNGNKTSIGFIKNKKNNERNKTSITVRKD